MKRFMTDVLSEVALVYCYRFICNPFFYMVGVFPDLSKNRGLGKLHLDMIRDI